MNQQHDTCVDYLHIHIAGSVFLFFFIYKALPNQLIPIILYLLSSFFHYTTRISIRMLANLYKRLTITTNTSPLTRMACELLPNMLRICVYTNFRNMFLKFAKPRKQPRMQNDHHATIAICYQITAKLCNTALTPERISYE